MSNSGVNTGFAKCFILFMAIVILLQGVVYLGLAIWGLTRESCSDGTINVSEKPFDFAMDIVYFVDEKCGAPVISVSDIEMDYQLNVDFDKSEEITNREYIFFIVYIVVSAVWVLTSFFIIATICCTVTPALSAIVYWPWFLAVMAGSILDAVATGYHIHDIVHTTSATSTFEYTGVTVNEESVMNILSTFDAYFVTPAVVMTCISSRVVLIWLLNIFGTGFCLSISNVLAKNAKIEKRINVAPNATENVANTQRAIEPNATNLQQQQSMQQPIQQPIQQYPPQIKPKPLQIQTAIVPLDRQNSYQQQLQQEQLQQQQQQNQRADRRTFEPLKSTAEEPSAPSPSVSDPRSATPNRQISTINEFPTYRNANTHPDKLDYPAQATPDRTTSPELSVISPLNNRYSVQEGPQISHQPPPKVNDELRSQLPWSYTSMLANPPPPPQRRVQSQIAPPPPPPKNMYPELPEPDYTLHPQRNARSTPNNNEMNIQDQQSYSRW